ncbi:MAG: amidohydrolase family protein [Oscillospiraceae bacterium]|nr:amidohydrolase family protein [Oscillospiraceae bacterium]
MKRIDLECHYLTEDMLSVFGKRTSAPFFQKETRLLTYVDDAVFPVDLFYDGLTDLAEKRINMMNENQIDISVLSPSPGVEQLPKEVSVPLARKVNDTLALAIDAHPGRFLGGAVLPVKDPEAACLELERCVKELGFVAWYVSSNFGDTGPDDAVYRSIFHKAEELGIFVYLHPYNPPEERFKGFGFAFNGAALGFTADAMRTLTRMILSGLMDECPRLKIVLGHLGESLPFLMERMDNRLSVIKEPRLKNKKSFSQYFKGDGNVLVTVSGNMSPPAFQCTQTVMGLDRIMFASEYPYEKTDDMIAFVDNLPLSDAERQLVYGGNASRHLGLPV